MEWFAFLFSGKGMSVLLPIILIVIVFVLLAIRAHHKHVAELDKIKKDIDSR